MEALKKKDTRKLLLESALMLMGSRSYAGTSVDDICKLAGVKKGSFYHFFDSKAELGKAALEGLWEEMRPVLDQIFSPHVAPLERLKNYAAGALLMQKAEQDKNGIVLGCPFTAIGVEQCAHHEGLTECAWELLKRYRKYFEIAVRDASEQGLITIGDYENTADALFRHYLGVLAEARLTNTAQPLMDLYQVWRTMLGLSPEVEN